MFSHLCIFSSHISYSYNIKLPVAKDSMAGFQSYYPREVNSENVNTFKNEMDEFRNEEPMKFHHTNYLRFFETYYSGTFEIFIIIIIT